MSTTLDNAHTDLPSEAGHEPLTPPSLVAVAGTSLLFSILQSACSAIIAINGVRFVIGLGSLAMTVGIGAAIEHFHQIFWLRIVLLVGSLVGSVITLVIPLRSRRLRHRPSARWRYQPLSQRQRRMEGFQIAIALLTLVLLVIEEYLHLKFLHTL